MALVAGAAAGLPPPGGHDAPSGTAPQVASHPPILIEGNGNFTMANGVTGGSGFLTDPYVIDGWAINASAGYGLQVRNTTAAFVVRDLNITDPSFGPPFPPPILFWNVSNALVENVTTSGGVTDTTLAEVTNVSLQGLDTTAAAGAGVTVTSGDDVSVAECTLSGFIQATADNLTIRSNVFPGGGGIKVVSSRSVRIEGNSVPNAMIRLNTTRDSVVRGNRAAFIWVWPGPSRNTTIDSNVVVSLHPYNAQYVNVTDNWVTGGMNFAFVSNVTVFGNRISDAPEGIYFYGSQDVLVYGNDFVNNTVQAQSDSNVRLRWNASYPIGGNYWSDYAGVDRCSGSAQDNCTAPDGFGDSPYAIDANDADMYPVMAFIGSDTTPPSVSIVSPAEGAAATSSPIPVSGTAYDTGGSGLQRVRVRVNGGPWILANGAASWTASVGLASGADRIEAQAVDGAGNPSPLASVNVTYNPPPPPANTPPYANFTWDPPTGNVTTAFTFTSTSWDLEDPAAALQVRWDWESDGTWDTPWSTNATATHTFGTPGVYNVTLEVTDTGSLTTNRTYAVAVTAVPPPPPPPLVVSIAAHPTSGTMPLTVTFNSTVGGGVAPYRYAWYFGDGTQSPASDTVHIYVTGGNFTVWLNVWDGADAFAQSRALYVNVTPAAVNLTVSLPTEFTSSASGITVTLSASATGGTPPYAFTWDFGDGGHGTGASVTHTYDAAGTYTISVTVQDAAGRTATRTYTLPVVGMSGPGETLFLPLVAAAISAAAVAAVFAALWLRERRRSPPARPPD